jgi:putative SOS response-associated peptidase YedK
MCGRFTLTALPRAVADLFGLSEAPDVSPRYNITPTQPVPVVADAGRGRKLAMLRWGLIPAWAPPNAGKTALANARAESLMSKPSFRVPLRRRRCLIPADGFYEWRKWEGHSYPYHFRLKGGAGVFAFAGLWDRWQGPEGPVDACAIVTTEANDLVRPVHDRMPVLLEPADFDRWLDPAVQDPAKVLPLLRPFPAERMEAVAVGAWVNNARHEGPECLQPAA